MSTRVTLLGDLFDGDTREVADDYGLYGVFIPFEGRTYIYRHKGDVECLDGSTQRYLEFVEKLAVSIPEITP